jgi:hypothetical protein
VLIHRTLRRRRQSRVARRLGDATSLIGSRPGASASGRYQVAPPSSAASWPEPAIPRSTLSRPEEEGQTTHVSRVRFKCFRCSISMFQLFHVDVVKVYRDVAYVIMLAHVCCKLLFLMFHLFFQTHIASVFI